MCQLMEEGLGWEHAVQFDCLALQDAMRAQINRYMVRHWSIILARSDDGNAYGNEYKQFRKCGGLQVRIIVDS